jgi:S1-C subfamily serine protease
MAKYFTFFTIILFTNLFCEPLLLLQETIHKIIDEVGRATVFIKVGYGGGTGIIIDENGYILTNYHVVSRATSGEVEVELHNKKKFKGKVLGYNSYHDCAIVKIEANEKLPYAKLGDSDKMKSGDFVIAIGNPFMYKGTASFGIISGTNRIFGGKTFRMSKNKFQPMIQTDASINPGNSGGPLVNIYGEVIGINTAILGPRINIGIAFAVPSNILKKYIPYMIEGKKFKEENVWLGIHMKPVKEEIARKYEIAGGVFVKEIDPRGPAEESLLKEKDIIIEVDGIPVFTPDDVNMIIAYRGINEQVNLTVIRKGERINIPIKVAKEGEK